MPNSAVTARPVQLNVKGGRCEACEGGGIVQIEMHFLPDIYVPCDVCKGKRYNRETLEVKYKDKNISDVLDMTVEEACNFFANQPKIARKLQTLQEVGLGYVQLGQSATTLSGGEAQRVKLANELARRDTGKTVYILDEPTTGLHIADVHRLVKVLDKLADAGNTVIVIEHNLDVIKRADYIIDLGPEGGSGGGTIVATGTPEQVAQNPNSFTGQYLKPVLERAWKLQGTAPAPCRKSGCRARRGKSLRPAAAQTQKSRQKITTTGNFVQQNAKLDLTIPVNLWFNYLYAPEKQNSARTGVRSSVIPCIQKREGTAEWQKEGRIRQRKHQELKRCRPCAQAPGRYLWL